MSNDKVRATFHPGVAPHRGMVLRGVGYAIVGGAFWVVNQIERHRIPRTKRYNLAHPPPPGARQGSSWVAKRSQDIDE